MSNRLNFALALAFGAAVAAGSGCSGRGSKQAPVGGDGATGASATSEATSEGSPMKDIQKLVAREFGVAPGDVKVEVESEPKTPGLTVFTAYPDEAKLGREAVRTGVYDGAQLLSESAAISAVARAWGYGATRTVAASDVARTFALLHSEKASVSAMLTAGEVQVFKQGAQPKRAAAAALPSEELVDGAPAVRYCIRSSSRAVPFSVVTAIFKDGGVELRTEAIPND